jgi:hypothetical protein
VPVVIKITLNRSFKNSIAIYSRYVPEENHRELLNDLDKMQQVMVHTINPKRYYTFRWVKYTQGLQT